MNPINSMPSVMRIVYDAREAYDQYKQNVSEMYSMLPELKERALVVSQTGELTMYDDGIRLDIKIFRINLIRVFTLRYSALSEALFQLQNCLVALPVKYSMAGIQMIEFVKRDVDKAIGFDEKSALEILKIMNEIITPKDIFL